MCRHLGYVGPPVAVGELVLRGTHSLYAQSWAPLDMRAGGTINADGFGVAWWRRAEVGVADVRDAVTRYRNPAPIWTDPAVAEVLGQLESRAVLAAVRSATVGMPIERSACAPFTDDHWAFSHNGVVPDWRTTLPAVLADLAPILNASARRPAAYGNGVTDRAPEFASPNAAVDAAAYGNGATDRAAESAVPDPAIDAAHRPPAPGPAEADRFASASVFLRAEALTDAAALWVVLRELLAVIDPDGPVTSAGEALRLLVNSVLRHQPTARLNLLLGNGSELWATTCWHALSVLVTDDYAVLSSEPYDADPRWRPIADRQLVTASPGHCTITALEFPASERVRS
ncbi:class II glutamine amidotransferase [Nocardia caishijiensis]|uniref:Gamma-glutamyl-hercynylcysteine sulfoxide hydrolase n=1 Tax=Nocardia caishijiensis TaxID=184756 RepID=A0ABQ6YSA1_9NOCA|nr:class II glutamine amidotransferase [Nocardia caishijiensis]KAF0848685.1 glutamine amidotransferase [Nocardia caishijiensis]